MKPILVLRHIACEGLGYLEEVFAQHRLTVESVNIDEDQPLPDSITHYSGLVIMGGPMSVNDDLPWIEQECQLIREAESCDIPVLGHCLGGQMICKALGGSITQNPVKEIGWLPVTQYDNAEAKKWFAGHQQFTAFHWHGETFSLPSGATPLLKSADCKHQAFIKGKLLALQCHLEITAQQVPVWADAYHHEIQQPSTTIQSRQQMLLGLDESIRSLQSVAHNFYVRWITCLPVT